MSPRTFSTKLEQKTYADAHAAMKVLLSLNNAPCGTSVDGMLDAFVGEHRTLQQAVVRKFVDMLIQWSHGSQPALVDARNEAAWELAREIRGLEPFLPYI